MSKHLCRALIAVALGACRCDETDVREAVPVAEIAPAPSGAGERIIDFGPQPVGSLSVEFITVHSAGATPLVFTAALDPASSEDFLVRAPAEQTSLEPGKSARVEVRYVPSAPGPDTGEVVLLTNDPAQPRVVVKLRGRGVSAGIRVCALAPGAASEVCHDEVAPERLGLDLGEVLVGTSKSGTVKVYSTGDRALRVGLMALAPGTPAGWSIDPIEVEAGFDLAAGQSRSVSVSYEALYGGPEKAELTIVSDDPNSPNIVVELRALGKGPRLCIEPLVVDFGEIPAGGEATDTVIVTSCGTSPLDVQSASAPGGEFSFVSAPAFPATLQPGESAPIHVRYRPVDAGQDETRFPITHSDGLRAFVTLRGTGTLCDLGAAPDPVHFGQTPVNTTVARNLALTNLGNSDCRVTQIGPPTHGVFTVQSAPALPLTLAPGRQVNVTLAFKPTAVQTYSATLRVASDDNDTPQRDVALQGSGQSVPACAFEASPPSLSFAGVSAGQRATQNVTVTQRGADECYLVSAGFSQGSSAAFTATVQGGGLGGVQLGPGGTATVTVTYAPQTAGTHSGTLEIIYDKTPVVFPGGGQKLTVPVVGSVLEPRLCVSPTQIVFSNIPAGGHAEQLLTLTSCGVGDLTVRRLGLSPGTSRDLSLLGAPPLPLKIAAGQQHRLAVAYHPPTAGADYGAVEIASNDATDPVVRVPIRANAGDACDKELRCAPASLQFSTVEVGRTAALSLTCIALGTQPVTASRVVLSPSTSAEFTAVPSTLNKTLQPGDSLRVEILYTPVDAGGDVGSVEVVNDGCDPRAVVQLTGAGKTPTFPPCPPPQVFSPVTKWEWKGGSVPDSRNVGMTPVVVNLTDDNSDGRVDEADRPEVVFTSCKIAECCVNCTPGAQATLANGDYSGKGILRAVRGESGAELWNVTDPSLMLTAAAQIAAADLDGDNFPEIVAPKHSFRPGQACPPPMPAGFDVCGKYSVGTLLAFDRNGKVFWESEAYRQPDTEGENGSAPLLVDLDQDGFPEVVFGQTVFDRNGRKLWETESCGSTGHGCFPVAADLDNDGRLELIAGKRAYRADGTLLWTASVDEGMPIVIDVDGDGISPEVIYRPSSTAVTIVNADGSVRRTITTSAHQDACAAPIAAADLHGDSRRELIVPSGDMLHVLAADGTFLWSKPINDAGGQCGASGAAAFDFEGDGKYEVVYHDTQKIWAFRGDGTVIYESPRESVTLFETPVVADVDNDNHADLLFTNTGNLLPPAAGVVALSNVGNNWPATRRVWMQHSYHVTDANENGTIPRHETPHWKAGPNSWRANVPLCR